MQIRRGAAADEGALAQIRRSAIRALAVPALSPEQAEAWAMSAAADRIGRALREHEVWVAVDEAAIGWVEIDGDRVAALYVAPPFARHGVGSALLACAEAVVRRSGYSTVRLSASANALAFYVRRGYRECGAPDADGAWPLGKALPAGRPNGGEEPR